MVEATSPLPTARTYAAVAKPSTRTVDCQTELTWLARDNPQRSGPVKSPVAAATTSTTTTTVHQQCSKTQTDQSPNQQSLTDSPNRNAPRGKPQPGAGAVGSQSKNKKNPPTDREPGWRLKKADWHSFRTLCDERLTADINNSPEAIASFTDTLLSIADETVPKSSATPKHVVNPWLDADCEKAIKRTGKRQNVNSTGNQLQKTSPPLKLKERWPAGSSKKRGGSAGDSLSPPSITALPSVKSGD